MSEINFDTSKVEGRILWLADYLKRSKGLSNKEFLDRAGLNSSYISDLKNQKIKKPSAEAVGSIVKTFGVNPYWLLDGEGEPFKNYLLESSALLRRAVQNASGKSISPEKLAVFLLSQAESFSTQLKDFLDQDSDDEA